VGVGCAWNGLGLDWSKYKWGGRWHSTGSGPGLRVAAMRWPMGVRARYKRGESAFAGGGGAVACG
jgi:hypothetical protein